MADGSIFGGKEKAKKRPRVAYTGEEFGFGRRATDNFVHNVGQTRRSRVYDAGFAAAPKTTNEVARETREMQNTKFDFGEFNVDLQPLRTKEQTLMAVKQNTADFAVVPFYHPFSGYDFETIRALSSLFTLVGVEQYEADDRLCLAVYDAQVLDLVQSSHPGSGLATLLKNRRRHYKGIADEEAADQQSNYRTEYAASASAGLTLDQSQQAMIRDRIDMVFAGPEAARRCKSKLDGLRGAGVEVAEVLKSIEPHREMARMARKTLDRNRQTNTFFDPRDGSPNYVSTMSSDRQDSSLYGVVLPFDVADRSEDFTIIDPFFDDAQEQKTRFMVVRQIPDETLYEDALRTTDAKTRYWMKRLRRVNDASDEDRGVRVMLRFQRAGAAASIGDVENYLRNYGVRHAVVRMGEDSNEDMPASVGLDIEFAAADFRWNPFRRLRGSVANGATKKAFQRWKSRNVTVLAAMPFDDAQLPRHAKRRWWNEAFGAILADAVETIFIRLTRIILVLGPIALVSWYIWKTFFGG